MAICSRPDIFFPVSTLAKQVHDPCHRHLLLAQRVVRYISGTEQKKIFHPRSTIKSDPLKGYVDADWPGCNDTRRSTTGILITINSAPVYWTSKRQSLVTLSSSEAEYVAISQCAKQIINLRRLFKEFEINRAISTEPNIGSTELFTDRKSAILIATKRQISERNKHIDLKAHYIKEKIEHNTIQSRTQTHEICHPTFSRNPCSHSSSTIFLNCLI